MANTNEFEALIPQAKVLVGAYWGPMMTDVLSFNRPWVISHSARKGLDALVAAGYLTMSPRNDHPKSPLEWRPTDKLRTEKPRISPAFMKEYGRFPMTDESLPEPVLPKRQKKGARQ